MLEDKSRIVNREGNCVIMATVIKKIVYRIERKSDVFSLLQHILSIDCA